MLTENKRSSRFVLSINCMIIIKCFKKYVCYVKYSNTASGVYYDWSTSLLHSHKAQAKHSNIVGPLLLDDSIGTVYVKHPRTHSIVCQSWLTMLKRLAGICYTSPIINTIVCIVDLYNNTVACI